MTMHDTLATAIAAYDAGDIPRAERLCRELLKENPNHAKALGLLGLIAHRARQNQSAIELMTRAIELEPDVPAFHINLAAALTAVGRADDAIGHCQIALRMKPQSVEALQNLGQALLVLGRSDESIAASRAALQLRPQSLEALNNLGHALRLRGRVDEAIEILRAAIRLRGDVPQLHVNLGNAFKDQARLDEAIAEFSAAEQLAPDDPSFASNRLYALCFHPRISPRELFDEFARWGARHPSPTHTFINDRNPHRRLRVGYVSADFRKQVLGLYIEPLLANHDRAKFEIFCYSDVAAPDAVTQRMMKHADTWRSTV